MSGGAWFIQRSEDRPLCSACRRYLRTDSHRPGEESHSCGNEEVQREILDAIDEQAYRCNAEMMQFESTCDNMPVVLCAGEFAGVRYILQNGVIDGYEYKT